MLLIFAVAAIASGCVSLPDQYHGYSSSLLPLAPGEDVNDRWGKRKLPDSCKDAKKGRYKYIWAWESSAGYWEPCITDIETTIAIEKAEAERAELQRAAAAKKAADEAEEVARAQQERLNAVRARAPKPFVYHDFSALDEDLIEIAAGRVFVDQMKNRMYRPGTLIFSQVAGKTCLIKHSAEHMIGLQLLPVITRNCPGSAVQGTLIGNASEFWGVKGTTSYLTAGSYYQQALEVVPLTLNPAR